MKDFSECYYDELIDFRNEFCVDWVDFIELKDKISDVQIKSKQKIKISNLFPKCFARIDNYGIKNKTFDNQQIKLYHTKKRF